jgi:hypothetical protein
MYHFGFIGQEKDNEIQGDGNSLEFGVMIYYSMSGRWLSVDPQANSYPSYSPYV